MNCLSGDENINLDDSLSFTKEDELGMFGDLGALDGGSALEDVQLETETESSVCPKCLKNYKTPRVLSCLHVFCEDCLKLMLNTENEGERVESPGFAKRGKSRGIVTCPICKQDTTVGERGVASLPLDPLSGAEGSLNDITLLGPRCTSCKAKDEAIAKCFDCDNFLCSICHTAHQYMRCFENHKVLTFEEMREAGETIEVNKVPSCRRHPDEEYRFYCNSCQALACAQCLGVFHVGPDHRTERMIDAESRAREELLGLSEETRSRQSLCRVAANKMEKLFGELEAQHDAARKAVDEAYNAYVAMLNQRREQLLEELGGFHSKQELNVMEACQRVERLRDRMDAAVGYTRRLLNEADAVGILGVQQSVRSQLQQLSSAAARPEDVNVSMKFEYNVSRFEELVGVMFGSLSVPGATSAASSTKTASSLGLPTPSPTPVPSSPSHSSPLEGAGALSFGLTSNLPPPTDLGRGVLMNLPPPVLPEPTPPLPPVGTPGLMDPFGSTGPMTSIQEYNIQQLAALAEQLSVSTSNDTFDGKGPSSSYGYPDLLPGSMNVNCHAYSNLQALAKLGSQNPLHLGDMPATRHSFSPTSSVQSSYGMMRNGSGLMGSNVRGHSPSSPLDSSLLASVLSAPYLTGTSSGSSSSALLSPSSPFPPISSKVNPMQLRVKFGQLGSAQGQFNSPHGFCLGLDEDILVADTNNHRIQVFDKKGAFKFYFGTPGKDDGQLWHPRKVAVIRRSGKIIVCDRGNERSRMQLFTRNGQFIKKIPIKYMEIVAGIAINRKGNIVIVDSVSPTVFEIDENGELEKWFDCAEYMREPSDIAVFGSEYFICDFKGHSVAVFNENGPFVRRIGDENVTPYPNGIDISDSGEVLVGNSHGNRFHVAVFSNEGLLVSEFECPQIKVSRCCGLKITSEGYIVTLAKNNHHVLVLNTLYIV